MIESLNDLKKLLKLCREQGVTEIKLGTVEIKLGDLPLQLSQQASSEANDPYQNFPKGELTPEQLMFYSSGGVPENDPAIQDESVA